MVQRLEREQPGADQACVRPELRLDDSEVDAGGVQQRLTVRHFERLGEEIVRRGGAETTTDDDELGCEDVEEGADRGAQQVTYVRERLQCFGVPLRGGW